MQIAAGMMDEAQRWLPEQSSISAQGLLVAGDAARSAATFNTPLGGVIFAIEELLHRSATRKNQQRQSTAALATSAAWVRARLTPAHWLAHR